MCNYDFEILQYNEFENLTRDLLQKEFGIFIESFKDGKDGGIDLRFGISKKAKCIVQVKRYKNWSSLKTQLEKEVEKVKVLNPERYILSTSVPLSPANKDTIKAIFEPYIHDTTDILGRDDINNLLDKHSDVEKQYYKLWLSSTEVLNELLHKSVRNWSRFELDTIREEIRTYVSNSSFNRAMEILKEQKYVIISGIPGIGKTTLARMLVYEILTAMKYDEFVCIEDNLHDAAGLFQEGKKQVFFFDDFLGSNTFVEETGFENKLISFIKAIRRESGKMFVLTTREYILAQAKEHYEKLQTNNIEIAKCTIDMGTYSTVIRARILYNHLADAALPSEYVEQLLSNNNYLNIVKHKNFNPRVIETYIDSGLWKQDPADQFVQSFVQLFDRPTCVWEKAFNALSPFGQYALLVLGTMDREVYVNDWRTAFKAFCKNTQQELHLSYSDAEFKKNIKVLEECFIRTRTTKMKQLLVALYNPSVRGFIVEYLKELQDLQRQLLTSAYYVEQLYSIFTDEKFRSSRGDAYVLLAEEIQDLAYGRLKEMMLGEMHTCELSIMDPDQYKVHDRLYLLFKFALMYRCSSTFMTQWITMEMLTDCNSPLRPRLFFIQDMDWSLMSGSREEAIKSVLYESMDIRSSLEVLETIHSMEMEDLLDRSYLRSLNETINDEIDNRLDDLVDTQSLMNVLEEMAGYLPSNLFPIDNYMDRINAAEARIMSDQQETPSYYQSKEEDYGTDEKMIEEMMTSLRVKE